MTKQFLLAVVLFTSALTFAQRDDTLGTEPDQKDDKLMYQDHKNMVKVSLTSLAFKNYHFQYERALNKTFSLGLSYSFIPEGEIPLKSAILNYADDAELEEIIGNTVIAYSSFTPEIRMYLGKGYGKGFYFAPFFRSSKYTVSGIDFEYELDAGGTSESASISTSGAINTNSFGLLLGAQFNLGKHIVLDWWIMGPHYGSSNGSLEGITDRTLSATEQQALLNELESLELPLTETTYEVTANSAKIIFDGPWGGVRSGISLGYRF